jgi:hypothetical protein
MEIKKVAWIKNNGGFYCTAYNSEMSPVGNIRIETKDNNYYIIAHDFFRGGTRAEFLSLQLGLDTAKEKGYSQLQGLLKAA